MGSGTIEEMLQSPLKTPNTGSADFYGCLHTEVVVFCAGVYVVPTVLYPRYVRVHEAMPEMRVRCTNYKEN